MANIINDLKLKAISWRSVIERSKEEYKDAQAELSRINNDISDETRNSGSQSLYMLDSLNRQKENATNRMSKAQLELVKTSAEISANITLIDEKVSKINKATSNIITLSSINKYGKDGLNSATAKAELQDIKAALQQLSGIRAELVELGYQCSLFSEGDEPQKVKSKWQEANPNKKFMF